MAGMVNNRLAEAGYLSGGDAPSPAALCVAPTRELASQIFTEALKFSNGTYLRPVVCYGGVSVAHQLSKLERGCHILIGTPGRLLDFAGRNKVSCSSPPSNLSFFYWFEKKQAGTKRYTLVDHI